MLITIPSTSLALNDSTCACDEGWYEIPSYGCFFFHTEPTMTWMEGQTFCEDNGGYLVEIVDAKLQEALTVFMDILYDGGYGSWTGGNDLGTERQWRWIHSENNISETFWHSGFPKDDDEQNCMYFYYNYDYYENWFDGYCSSNRVVTCQKPARI